jgi:hypothetical protein
MSQLRVSGTNQPDFYLNVLNFDAPITGELNSAQTQSQVQYFPIKAFQMELVCDVIFPSENLWQQWQAWVRQNMINSQNSNTTGNPGVTLNWPQRNINNWTGVIPSAKAGGMRANYAPRTRVEFQLIVSLVSNLNIFSSFGSAWQGLFGSTTVGANVDPVLNLAENFIGGAITEGNGIIFGGSGGGSSIGGGSSLVPTAASLSGSVSSVTSLIPGVSSIIGGGIAV